jgi:two-component system response regulator YesN
LTEPVLEDELLCELRDIIEESRGRHGENSLLRRDNEIIRTMLKDLFFQSSLMVGNQFPDYLKIKELLNIQDCHVSVGLIESDFKRQFKRAFVLKSILEEEIAASSFIGKNSSQMTTIIERSVFFAIDPLPKRMLEKLIERVRRRFYSTYQITISATIFENIPFNEINIYYTKLKQSMEYRFYLGEGITLISDDIPPVQSGSIEDYSGYYDRIAIAVKTGNLERSVTYTEKCFALWEEYGYSASLLKFLCLELISYTIRHIAYEKTPPQSFVHIISDNRDQPERLFGFTQEAIIEMTKTNFDCNKSRNSQIIKQVIECIETDYKNDKLSLQWIAKNIAFMSEDYVGKLFKKEIGINFNPYLSNYRIEMAKKLLRYHNDVPVSEVAQYVGFPRKQQYFGYLFKRVVGKTPTEYRKACFSDSEQEN